MRWQGASALTLCASGNAALGTSHAAPDPSHMATNPILERRQGIKLACHCRWLWFATLAALGLAGPDVLARAGALPRSAEVPVLPLEQVPTLSLAPIDVAALIAEDAAREATDLQRGCCKVQIDVTARSSRSRLALDSEPGNANRPIRRCRGTSRGRDR